MTSIFLSKFVKTLKTLSEEELRFFGQWLNSPWCNSNKNLISLFEKLKVYYPLFEDSKLTKEKLFNKILPNGKYSNRRLNNLLSEAYLTLERFLVFQNLAKDEALQNDLRSKEFQNRHIDDWFLRDTNKLIEKLEAKPIKEWEDHLDLLRFNRRIHGHPFQDQRMKPGAQMIIKMSDQLDILFLLEKAAIINEMIFRNRLLKNENHEVQPKLKKWLSSCEGVSHPSINFYKRRFAYTEENFLNEYFKLKYDFIEQFEQLNQKEKKAHLLSLLNDTTQLFRARLVDATASLPLYKLGIKSKILFNRGKLTSATFASVVTTSNTKKDFEFSDHFIENYIQYVDESEQEDVHVWALAHTAYRKENLKECIDLLLSTNFKSRRFQIMSKFLTCQVYFDLYLEEASYQIYLFNYFDSYEKWVLREKIGSEIYKVGFLRFIQKCRSLAKYYSDIDFNPEKVKRLLEEEKNVQGAQWLSKRIDKVIKLRT